MQSADILGKTDSGKAWRQEKKGITEDKMVGRRHWLNGHEFEQAPGDGEGQGSLACCSPWGDRVGHDWATEQQLREKLMLILAMMFWIWQPKAYETKAKISK